MYVPGRSTPEPNPQSFHRFGANNLGRNPLREFGGWVGPVGNDLGDGLGTMIGYNPRDSWEPRHQNNSERMCTRGKPLPRLRARSRPRSRTPAGSWPETPLPY